MPISQSGNRKTASLPAFIVRRYAYTSRYQNVQSCINTIHSLDIKDNVKYSQLFHGERDLSALEAPLFGYCNLFQTLTDLPEVDNCFLPVYNWFKVDRCGSHVRGANSESRRHSSVIDSL